jgi:SulP family sulfate permease
VSAVAGRRAAMGDALQPRRLLQALNAALLLYLIACIVALSIATLVYAGPLAPHLPQALGGVLTGAALLLGIVTLFSSWGGTVATVQDASGVIIALGTASAVAALAGQGADASTRYATASVLVALVTLSMALLYLLVRAFRLGALVRFMPHPVMGGFLAGTGWLLVVGGIGITTRVPLGPGLVAPDVLAKWVPALALGVAMLLVVRRFRSAAPLALVLALALAVFYGGMALAGRPFERVAADGWLLGPFPEGLTWQPWFGAATLAAVDWPALAAAAWVAAPALLIGTIALLLNTSALELVVKRDISPDRELLAHGAANLASGLAGGLIGYTAISFSTLSHTLAGGRRLPGVLVALGLLATAVFGTALVAAMPRFVMGGLLVFIGFGLLHEWLVAARRTLARAEYALVVAIFAVIAIEDFLLGVALGLAATTVLFVVNYGRIGAVRFELTGDALRSRVVRGPSERARLDALAHRLVLFRLHGYLFFGSASGLLDRVRRRLASGDGWHGVVLDFEQVPGVDATALASFARLAQQAAEHGAELVVTGLSRAVAARLDREPELASLRRFADADRGIEWCEEQLLARDGGAATAQSATLREHLLALLPDRARIDALLANTTRRALAAGEHLVHAGDPADALFLVESGLLTARLPAAGERAGARLQTMRTGSVIGELGMLLGSPRSADVVAECDSVLCVIAQPQWRHIVEHEPEIARTLDQLLLRLLGERVVHLTRVVDALQR